MGEANCSLQHAALWPVNRHDAAELARASIDVLGYRLQRHNRVGQCHRAESMQGRTQKNRPSPRLRRGEDRLARTGGLSGELRLRLYRLRGRSVQFIRDVNW